MSSILFITWDGGGNVPPLLGIAAELQSRGHQVRVMGHAQQAEFVEASGLSLVPFTTARAFTCGGKNSPFDYLGVFGDRAMGRDVLAELADRPADLVVVDCLLFGPIEAVAASGTPYVLLEHTYAEYFTRTWMRGPMGTGLRIKRFATRELVRRARLRVVATLPELDPATARPVPANVRYCGPVVRGTPAAPATPTVLVSLSTVNFPGMQACLQNVLDALATLPVRGIVTTGPVIDPADLRAPANVELHRYVPHAQLMPQASVVVGHGGHATTMLALSHDLPVLVLPMHPMLDQKMVGTTLVDAGAGRLLTKRAKPDALAAAIRALLEDGPHRAAAARLGAAIRAQSGAAAGADLIDGLLAQPSVDPSVA
ncbi:glycosyl transferase [Nocardioides phosphati]|uniref:Glycosyl transferase n=1 Tax=Nocardioides phosphati TaxID=1867775 RepID=A0ABQ2NC47_9ACTN|nr:nucleotide disphospho-sugar-binding domain-containing protein [Nocardioides phosphati]GGO90393.1 glycosyl transferase [Nocardioides phosphati]